MNLRTPRRGISRLAERLPASEGLWCLWKSIIDFMTVTKENKPPPPPPLAFSIKLFDFSVANIKTVPSILCWTPVASSAFLFILIEQLRVSVLRHSFQTFCPIHLIVLSYCTDILLPVLPIVFITFIVRHSVSCDCSEDTHSWCLHSSHSIDIASTL